MSSARNYHPGRDAVTASLDQEMEEGALAGIEVEHGQYIAGGKIYQSVAAGNSGNHNTAA